MKQTLFCILLLAAQAVFAQSPSRQEVLQVIRDADYSFKRFDELTKQIPFSRWRPPEGRGDELVTGTKEALDGVRTERTHSGNVIASLYSANTATSIDLLEVMSALGAVGIELESLADSVMNWQDRDTADEGLANDRNALYGELNAASGSALRTEAAMFVLLHQKLVADSEVLISCSKHKAANNKATPK